jgi:ribosomal protein L40E
LNYTGLRCPICKKTFHESDDIVVCPECGAPYHRSCYEEKGQCIFDDLHKEHKAWTADPPAYEASQSEYSSALKDKECPVCGTLNDHNATFCMKCGSNIASVRPGVQIPQRTQIPGQGSNGGSTQQNNDINRIFSYGAPFYTDPLGGVNPTDTVDDAVTYSDISAVVMQNTMYYIPVFKRKKTEGHSRFNFAAFMFSGAWFLYRKQYKLGAILTSVMFILYLSNICISNIYSYPILMNALTQVGYIATISLNNTVTAPTTEQYNSAILIIMQSPGQLFLVCLPALLCLAMLVIMIVSGIISNNIYLNYCIDTVHELRNKTTGPEEYNLELAKKAGVNPIIALVIMVCYMICAYVPTLLGI